MTEEERQKDILEIQEKYIKKGLTLEKAKEKAERYVELGGFCRFSDEIDWEELQFDGELQDEKYEEYNPAWKCKSEEDYIFKTNELLSKLLKEDQEILKNILSKNKEKNEDEEFDLTKEEHNLLKTIYGKKYYIIMYWKLPRWKSKEK